MSHVLARRIACSLLLLMLVAWSTAASAQAIYSGPNPDVTKQVEARLAQERKVKAAEEAERAKRVKRDTVTGFGTIDKDYQQRKYFGKKTTAGEIKAQREADARHRQMIEDEEVTNAKTAQITEMLSEWHAKGVFGPPSRKTPAPQQQVRRNATGPRAGIEENGYGEEQPTARPAPEPIVEQPDNAAPVEIEIITRVEIRRGKIILHKATLHLPAGSWLGEEEDGE